MKNTLKTLKVKNEDLYMCISTDMGAINYDYIIENESFFSPMEVIIANSLHILILSEKKGSKCFKTNKQKGYLFN